MKESEELQTETASPISLLKCYGFSRHSEDYVSRNPRILPRTWVSGKILKEEKLNCYEYHLQQKSGRSISVSNKGGFLKPRKQKMILSLTKIVKGKFLA